MRAVGYVRVSTDEQGASGLGLEAQRRAIRGAVQQRGWDLAAVYEDTASGKTSNGRPGLRAAIDAVEGDAAAALVVAKLDRLSRSLKDLGDYLERSAAKGWALVVLDPGVDTSTPHGEAMAGVAGVFARLEARLISQRTRDALAVARARGVRLGRPPVPPSGDVVRRIRLMRHNRGRAPLSFATIAQRLNDRGVPTPRGGRWHAEQVRRVLVAR